MKISGQGWNTQDAAARREEMFAKLDRDGDKKITKDEMKAAMSERGGGAGRPRGGPSLDEIFSRIDANEDGAIDQDEHEAFASSLASRRPQGPPDASRIAQHLLEQGDTDGDDKLTTNYDKSGGITVSIGESRTLGVA